VIEASVLRLRPILMTTFATVLGAVPLAIATGAGPESLRPSAGWWSAACLVGTLFTLFVVPVAYTSRSSCTARARAAAKRTPRSK
jgi:multidrug efflux pump